MARKLASSYIGVMVFPPFDPAPPPRRRRFKAIPVRTLLPNLITLLALCAGLTAIRMAVENRLDLALAAIVLAVLLDGIDGRIARLLKGTSRFGAELDSLADFVNFGVAPALILYFWGLQELKSAGWIAALVFAICAALRLARFNVMIDDPNQPAWAGNFFTGIPAPAGAITVLLPIYLYFLGVSNGLVTVWLTLFYTLAIALLMVSRLPVFSGKARGQARAAGAGAAGVRGGCVVLRVADQLSVGGPHHRHAHLSRLSPAWLAVLSRISAQGSDSRNRSATAAERCADGAGPCPGKRFRSRAAGAAELTDSTHGTD